MLNLTGKSVVLTGRAKGFSLLEIMIVVAIVGVMSAMAIPNLSMLVKKYRAQESIELFYSNLNYARALSIKINEPIVVKLTSTEMILYRGNYAGDLSSFLLTATNWNKEARRFRYHGGLTILDSGELITGSRFCFCPSGDYRFLDGEGLLAPKGINKPVCGLSRMASVDKKIHFKVLDEERTLFIRGAVASLRLRAGLL